MYDPLFNPIPATSLGRAILVVEAFIGPQNGLHTGHGSVLNNPLANTMESACCSEGLSKAIYLVYRTRRRAISRTAVRWIWNWRHRDRVRWK